MGVDKKISDEERPGFTAEGDIDIALTLDPAVEHSYVRKLDLYLLPFLSLMLLLNSVDKSNLGNAKTDNFDVDMHFTGNQYSLLLLLFYIPTGLCDLPLNILTKKYSGRWVLSGLCVFWGTMGLLEAACNSFASMLVVRLLIGAAEAGFFAGVVFYLTLFYTRSELGFRLGLFFGSAVVAAAFSGLLAYGVFQITGTDLKGWQYLFIIEGGLTVIVGAIGFIWLPSNPQTCRWFTPAEKAVASIRRLQDHTSQQQQDTSHSFSWHEATTTTWKKKPFLWSCYAVISFTYPVCWITTSNFLPQIVARLGYDTVKTNLWTVAPNCVGFVVLLATTYSSDRFRERAFHICFGLSLGLVGLIILATIDVLEHKGVAYFACFVLASGAYIPSCLVHSWHNNNNPSESARAVNTGILVGLGNLAGLLSTGTFRTEFAPKYVPTLVVTACCSGVCIVFTMGLGIWMKMENRRRDREEREDGDREVKREEEEVQERSVGQRYFT